MDFLKRVRESRLAMLRFAFMAILGCAGLPIGDTKV
jgi:hypothetical protein